MTLIREASVICAFLSLLPLATSQDAARRQAREQWFLRGRTGSAAARKQGLQRQGKSPARSTAAAIGKNDGWTPVGPLPLASDASGAGQQDYGWIAGRVTSIAVDPNDLTGNTVYAGGAFGGIWKSTNAGPASPVAADVRWRPLTDDRETLAMGAIAVQPPSQGGPGTIVLGGTGETNSAIDSYYGLGILRSTDSGNTWALIQQDQGNRSFAGIGFSKIVFSTDNPDLVVAATGGTAQGGIDGLSGSANLGIYYSADAGATWNRAAIQDGGTAIQPGSVTSLVYNEVLKTFFAAVRYHGFYTSTDGSVWTRIAKQPGDAQLDQSLCPAVSATSACPIYRGELASVPGRSELFAWYVDITNTDMGIWRSLNGGGSWQQISTTSISDCGDQTGCGTDDGAYNLALAAVPDGPNAGETDIYAGTINLYKCRTTASVSDCLGTGSSSFLNLTHAYGCSPLGAPAHVHPQQHAIDFLQVNNKTQAVMYFANDGGVYRSLDGYTGLISGNCETANNFDDLNQGLGSLTQFLSLAQHPTQANTMLGGAPGAGFPATAQSLATSEWRNVNVGEGGFSAINPANPDQWFTGNSGTSIQQCPFGIECLPSDFALGQVVSSTTLGGDVGGIYTPFLLDPVDAASIIVGTCRIWRGQTDGSGFLPLSVNFETGSVTGCGGSEVNQVRALAAFQVANKSFPEIIYAGTDGFGPLVTSGPLGGHVWVSDPTNPVIWHDRTGTINPNHFPISAIAIDPFDAETDPTTGTAGQVAYVALGGFGGHHFWRTNNAGLSWMNFDGFGSTQLPDVPANAIVIDSDAQGGSIYVGTDRGVYVTRTNDINGASWVEVGATSGGGTLPNVPVTALQIFNDGTTKLLRAATYGRGVWQFVLSTAQDFQMSVPSPTQIALAGETAHFTGSLSSINEYPGSVTLSCMPNGTVPPSQCTPPATLGPPIDDATFDLAVSGSVGKYLFKLHAVGSGINPPAHDVPLTLQVIDYGLNKPSPAAVTVLRTRNSPPISVQVTAAGAFSGTVSLTCLNLPADATCSFSPSSSAEPRANSPVTVAVKLHPGMGVAAGKYAVILDAASGGVHRTQTISMTVVADYNLEVADSSLQAATNTSVSFQVLVTSSGGYNTPVHLTCGGGAPPTCVPSPATLTPTEAGMAASIAVASDVVRKYDFVISGQSDDRSPVIRSVPVSFSATGPPFDFDLINTSGPQTVRAGQVASFTVSVAPQPPSDAFPGSVALASCSGLPTLSTCTVTPQQISSGEVASTVTVVVATTAPVLASSGRSGAVYALCLPGLMVLFCRKKRCGTAGVLLLVALLFTACGGGGLSGAGGGGAGQPGTTPGDYSVKLTASCAGVSHNISLALKVD